MKYLDLIQGANWNADSINEFADFLEAYPGIAIVRNVPVNQDIIFKFQAKQIWKSPKWIAIESTPECWEYLEQHGEVNYVG